MLAGRMATGLATADDASVSIGQLAQQVEILVVDVHGTRSDAIDEDRVFLGNLVIGFPLIRHSSFWWPGHVSFR